MSIADYQGRRYDLLALRGVQPVGEVELSETLFDIGSPGEVCVGVVKLTQRWALEFLTELGSMTYQPTRGCRFLTTLRHGTLRTEADVLGEFNYCQVGIRRSLVNEQPADMPVDEQFASAALISVVIYNAYLELHVQVNSVAGTNRMFIMPLSVVP